MGEGVEGALVHAVEPGFVAVQELELVIGAESGEGFGTTAVLGIGSASVEGLVPECGFGSPDPTETPCGDDDFLYYGILDPIGGVELLEMFIEKLAESFPTFPFEDD